MLWLGLGGRVKIAALEARMDRLEQAMKDQDLELTDSLDKLAGIAKRFTGRKGGRPPKEEEPNGELAFTRHVGWEG